MTRALAGGIVAAITCLAFASARPAAAAAPDAASTSAGPVVLSVWNRPLATFRATVGDVPPGQRARNAASRIAGLPDVSLPVTTRPAEVAGASGILISAGDHPLFGLVTEDLDPESARTLERAASDSASRVRELLDAQRTQRELPTLLRGIGYSALVLAGFTAAVWLIGRLRRATVGRVLAMFRNRKLTIGGIDLAPTLATVERATFRVLSWTLILGMAYTGLVFIFGQFPLTVPLGERLGEYVWGHLTDAGRSAVLALPSLLGVVAVLLVTRAISLWISRLLVEIEQGLREVSWLAQEQAKATRRIASGVIWMLGIATAYPLLPWSGSLAFQGMSVVFGLAVSFASGGLVNHWVSGLMVLYARSYRVGEFVRVGEVEGVVAEMGALATKLRTMRREVVTIPNALMAGERLVNYTRLATERGALLSTSIAIGYDVPWRRVRELLSQAAVATAGVARDPEPRVLPWELEEFFVRYQLHVHLERDVDRVAVRAELNSRILDTFGAAGVQIMTPHFESQPERPVIAAAAEARA